MVQLSLLNPSRSLRSSAIPPALAPLHRLGRWARALLGSTAFALLAACGGGGDGASTPGTGALESGRFIDAPVQGLSYTAGAANGLGQWTARESVRFWRSVASSADGSKLVAVALNAQIYTSTDSGVTWTARENSRDWRSVASSADGSKLVAVVQNGPIYTSTDSGVTWTARESNRRWWSVASSADGSKLVAVVRSGQIYTSTDSGVTWTARENARDWASVASSADGSKLVASSAPAVGGQIYTSTDSGVTWTPRESSRNWRSVASSADGSKLVAVVLNGHIYTSTDSGVTWTARGANRNWFSVASSNDGSKLVAGSYGGPVYTSNDSGVTWTARESDRYWQSIASSADGSKLVAVHNGGQIQTYSEPPIQTTNNKGEYACTAGSDVVFSLGNQSLGALKCGQIAHVYQMAGSAQSIERGIRIARLLQSLDMTPASTDHIQLPNLDGINVNIRFDGSNADFEADANALIAQLKAQKGLPAGNSLVSSLQAQAHVQAELLKLSEAERMSMCQVNYCKSELLSLLAAPQGVGGTVSGLPANKAIQLQLSMPSGTQVLSLAVNSTYGFVAKPAVGQNYSVARIDTDPSVSCTIANASGVMPVAGVSNVNVTCAAVPVSSGFLGGVVSGLGIEQYVSISVEYLDASSNPTSQTLVVYSNGPYTFDEQSLPGDTEYQASVVAPPGLSCTIDNAIGRTPLSYTTSFTISNLNVSCTSVVGAAFTVGGTVSGLPLDGSVVTLVMASSDIGVNGQIRASVNGPYEFLSAVPAGSSFSIAALSPAGYTCTVQNGYSNFTVANANVSNADVVCVLGGGGGGGGSVALMVTTSGLDMGEFVTLQLLAIGIDESVDFSTALAQFPTLVPDGTPITVNLTASPAGKSCQVFAPAVASAAENQISVVCEVPLP